MAKKATEKEEVKATVQTLEDNVQAETTNRTFVLNGYNFTAVGETFLTLCHPKIVIPTKEKELIVVAEEQVRLGFLKEEK